MARILPAGILLLTTATAAHAQQPDSLTAAVPDSLSSRSVHSDCSFVITEITLALPAFTTIQPALSRIAGVQVTPYSGAPGAWSAVRIRGVANLTGSSQPLYVVDGVPVYNYDPTPESWNARYTTPVNPAIGILSTPFSPAPNPLLDIPLEDIAQIEVVKGAAATARYGGQGTNGVICISTRRGAEGRATAQPLQVRYAGWGGVQQVRQRYDLLSARQYADLVNVAAVNNRRQPPYSTDDLASLGEVDWQDEVFRVAGIQNHNLSVNGLTQHRTRYYVAADYLRQTGVVVGSDLSRYQLRTNVEQQVNDKLLLGLRVSGSQTNQHHPGLEPNAGALLRQALLAAPAVPARNVNGASFPPDPLRDINTSDHPGRTRRLLGQLQATYQFTPALTLRAFGGYERTNVHDHYLSDYTVSRVPGSSAATRYIQRDSAEVNVTSWVAGAELRYQRTWAERHAFTVGLSYLRQQYTLEQWRSTWQQSSGTNPDPQLNPVSWSRGYFWLKNKSVPLHSPTASVSYLYGGRYEVQASLRSDFVLKDEGVDRQFFWFPGGALRWHLDKEAFLQDVSAISSLTLQGGIGYTSNSLFNPYFMRPYVAIIGPNPVGGSQETLGPDRTTHLDAGLHLGLLGNRLTMDATVYARRTARAQAYISTPSLLDIDLRNRGLELTLSGAWTAGPLRGQTTVAAATNRNELAALRLANGLEYRDPRLEVGQPIDRLLAREQNGTYPATDPSAGRIQLRGNTATTQGNGLPRYTLNVFQQLDWNKWQLTTQFDGLFGYELFNPTLLILDAPTGSTNASTRALDYWTPTHQNTNIPQPGAPAISAASTLTNLNLASGNHVRLSQLQVSYELLRSGTRKASVWVGGQNLFVTGKYRGFDPNVSSAGASPLLAGQDVSVYPVARVWQVGIRGQF